MIFGGCAASKKMVPKIEKPKQQVMENITKYNVSLSKIGDMLEDIKDSDIYVYITPISNKTAALGKLPQDIEGMLKTAILNMGYKVHLVADPNVILEKGFNVYVIEGEISEFDTIKEERASANVALSFGKGKGATEAEAEGGYNFKEMHLGIDLRIYDGSTGEYLPFVFSKNKITLKRIGDSNRVGIFIAGNGFGIGGEASIQNGLHESIRLLSEIGTVEVIGRLKLLPYWTVIPNAKPDYRVINNYKRSFRAFDEDRKKIYIAYLLSYFYPQINEKNKDQLIIDFKKRHALYPYDSKLTPELFATLLINLPKHASRELNRMKKDELLDSLQ